MRAGRNDLHAREGADRGPGNEIHHPLAFAAADHFAGFFRMIFRDQNIDLPAEQAAVVLQLDAGLQLLQGVEPLLDRGRGQSPGLGRGPGVRARRIDE